MRSLPLVSDGASVENTLRVLRETKHLLSSRELQPSNDELRAEDAERARRSRRVWAAIMLAGSVFVCDSILRGDAVIVRRLDASILQIALRGDTLPPLRSFLVVTDDMLDAVSEAGPFS